MAIIWHMCVNLATELAAQAFVDHYDKSRFKVPHAGEIELRLDVEKNKSGGWEVNICPYVEHDDHGGPWHLNGHGGPATPEEAEDIDACAKVLYERLGKLFSYRFALTGFEVGDWRSAGELFDDISPGGLYLEHRKEGRHTWDGLVVSYLLYEAADCPEGFEVFGTGYWWTPFKSIELSGG